MVHRRINHKANIYGRGDSHTNSVEDSGRSLSGIGGVYNSAGLKYLHTYPNEYSWRYDCCDQRNLLFRALLEQISKRTVD